MSNQHWADVLRLQGRGRPRASGAALAARRDACQNAGIRGQREVRPLKRAAYRLEQDGSCVRRFPWPKGRSNRWRSTIAAGIVLMALLGSLAAATLGPAIGQGLSYPLLVMLMLVGG